MMVAGDEIVGSLSFFLDGFFDFFDNFFDEGSCSLSSLLQARGWLGGREREKGMG